MKLFKFPALLVALFGISVAVTGCGGSDDGANTPGVGGAGYNGGLIRGGQTPTADGGMAYRFIGNNVYNLNGFLTGGPAQYSTYSGYFTGGYASWGFSQAMNTRYFDLTDNCTMPSTGYPQAIPLTMLSGATAMSYPPLNSYSSVSSYELGASMSISVSQHICGVSSVQGTLTLPPAFIARNTTAFPQGSATPISGIAIDLKRAQGGQIYGGVLIYTTPSTGGGYHGAFLAF